MLQKALQRPLYYNDFQHSGATTYILLMISGEIIVAAGYWKSLK